MTTIWSKIALSISAAAVLTLTPQALAERPASNTELSEMAEKASTPAEHARVARSYLVQSREMTAKADKLLREVEKSKANKSSMEAKWPAMVVNARERKEQLAAQLRRGAEESYQLAVHHSNLAGQSIDQIAALD